MTNKTTDEVLGRTFRASPGYDLVLYDHLNEAERAALSEAAQAADFYGVLRPADPRAGTVKVVDTNTALLLHALAQPGPVPTYVRRSDPERTSRGITQLVLDGVLEVQNGDEFVSGADATECFSDPPMENDSSSRIARLSRRALDHAAGLGETDGRTLAAVLYGFNRQPVKPRAARALPDVPAVLHFLGATDPSALGWRTQQPDGGAWLTWMRRSDSPSNSRSGGPGSGPRFKLYVSPQVETLPEVFPSIAECLRTSRAAQFKTGANAAGVHRSDKIVAYFDSLDELANCAASIRDHVDGAAAQGVPFTAEIGEDGLLSWGMDPPREAQLLSLRGVESWRAWLTNRLGLALAQAVTSGASASATTSRTPTNGARSKEGAVSFALARARSEGIDTERWTPETSIWNAYTSEL